VGECQEHNKSWNWKWSLKGNWGFMPEYDGYGRLWMIVRNNRLEREREEVGRHGVAVSCQGDVGHLIFVFFFHL